MSKELIRAPKALEGCAKPALGIAIVGLCLTGLCLINIPPAELIRITNFIFTK